MNNKSYYPWQRFWIRQGEAPIMENGYLVEPSTEQVRWLMPKANGMPFAALHHVKCLILLGDVGMGKSVTIDQEAKKRERELEGEEHEVIFLDLKRRTENQFHRGLFENRFFKGWAEGRHKLTVFLDSLDECWRRFDELGATLVNELREFHTTDSPIDNRGLYLRLTCRSAEWREETEEALRSLFGKDEEQFAVYTLAPLSKQNVFQAAECNSINGDQLVDKIAQKRCQPFASHPITLEMLIKLYREKEDFPANRFDLYEQGCLKLCEDHHSEPAGRPQRITNPRQRLAIAGRLAALSVLSNRYLINGDADSPLNRRDILDATETYGYFPEVIEGESVIVNQQTARETLQTALFSDRINNAQNWSHQSYAEFLAARYLIQKNISTVQLISLMVDTNLPGNHILPQLEEIACWLVDLNAELFEALVPANADIFLRCEIGRLNETKRAKLIEHYLNLICENKAPDIDWIIKQRFRHVAYPDLPVYLRSVILNSNETPKVLEAAIDIAYICEIKDLAPQLLQVFLDKGQEVRVRKRSGFALKKLADDKLRVMLKEQADTASLFLDDEDDDLKGYYLYILWPSHLSLDKLLTYLTPPKKGNYVGSYRIFLEYELPNNLQVNDLPPFLDWLRVKGIGFDILSPYRHVGYRVALRSYHNLQNPEVLKAFLKLTKNQIRQMRSLLGSNGDGKERDLKEETPNRQIFWRAIVSSKIDIRQLINFAKLRKDRILVKEDLPWFVECYQHARSTYSKTRWLDLVFFVYHYENLEALDILSPLAQKDEEVAQRLVEKTSCSLVPDRDNWQKENYYREQETKRKETEALTKRPKFCDLLGKWLDHIEDGNISAFWKVVELLEFDPEDFKNIAPLHIDLGTQKAWQSLPLALRERILKNGLIYLKSQEVEWDKVWDRDRLYMTYCVANQLLTLLYDKQLTVLVDIQEELWAKWVPVLFAYYGCYNSRHNKAWMRLYALAFQKAQIAAMGALRHFLSPLYLDHSNKRSLIWQLTEAWNSEIEKTLFDYVGKQVVDLCTAQEVFQLLVSQKSQGALSYLESLVQNRHTHAQNCYAPIAAAVLLLSVTEEWGNRLIDLFEEKFEFGKAVTPYLVRNYGKPKPWLPNLSENTIARLWHWLMRHFPGDPYDDDDRNSTVTVAHEIYDLRQAAFNNLSTRGTAKACEAMRMLIRLRPNDCWLGGILAEMQKNALRIGWQPSIPQDLMKCFADSDSKKRIIQTDGDLHGVIVESLQRYEQSLRGETPVMELWNEDTKERKKIWWPKDENNLSDCLKRHLERDLKDHGLFAGREVEIRQKCGTEAAQLVDLFVMAAIPNSEKGQPGSLLKVIIEVKCVWNNGVYLDMKQQLFNRYLRNNEYRFGIYVVGYFTCEGWNCKKDKRKTRGACKDSLDEMTDHLGKNAKELSTTAQQITAFVLDARLET